MKIMRAFIILALIIGTYLFHHTSAQGNFAPIPSTLRGTLNKPGRRDEIQNLTFYGLNWITPKDAPIMRFESTMIIPNTSNITNPLGHLNAIWPGLQNADLLQNVVTNQAIGGGGPREWYHLPFYCCHPGNNMSEQVRIHPGDALTSRYVWDIPHNKYVDSWTLVTGSEGYAANSTGFTGGLVYDQKIATAGKGGPTYHHAILRVELQGNGKWDWGPITWRNVIIMAHTKEQDWCAKYSGGENFNFRTTVPVVTTEGDLTTCYIATVVFQEPTDHHGEQSGKAKRD